MEMNIEYRNQSGFKAFFEKIANKTVAVMYDVNTKPFALGIKKEIEQTGAKVLDIYFADEEASDRLDYLTSQIYHSLCSEPTNIYQATNKLVNSFHLKKWERILTPREVNSTESVLGAMFTFTVGIEENTFYQNTLQIKEFYEQLKIRDEFIDTLTKKIIGE